MVQISFSLEAGLLFYNEILKNLKKYIFVSESRCFLACFLKSFLFSFAHNQHVNNDNILIANNELTISDYFNCFSFCKNWFSFQTSLRDLYPWKIGK